jgi:hypothetical protein
MVLAGCHLSHTQTMHWLLQSSNKGYSPRPYGSRPAVSRLVHLSHWSSRYSLGLDRAENTFSSRRGRWHRKHHFQQLFCCCSNHVIWLLWKHVYKAVPKQRPSLLVSRFGLSADMWQYSCYLSCLDWYMSIEPTPKLPLRKLYSVWP